MCILKRLYNTFKIGKIVLGFGHYQKILPAFSHCTARMAETSDSEEELFLIQSCFNGSSNRGNDELEKFVFSNNRQVDHENAQLKRRQKGCSALTTRTNIKKSQSAVLKKRLKQTRRKCRRGIS